MELWNSPTRDTIAIQQLEREMCEDVAALEQRRAARSRVRMGAALFEMINWRVQDLPPVPFRNSVSPQTGYTHSPDVWKRTLQVRLFWPATQVFATVVGILLSGSLVAFWTSRRKTGGSCSVCNYDMRGSTTDVCPECGTPASQAAGDWRLRGRKLAGAGPAQ